jgi:TPP-dependent pyruvate/acetoin dehydrogenase alpha subunit
MRTKKVSKVSETSAGAKRFSLVSALAQEQMYAALASLKPAKHDALSGAEVAEIAIRAALGENDPVIVGGQSRTVATRSKARVGKPTEMAFGQVAQATLSAIAGLIRDPKASALVCAGKLTAEPEVQEESRKAFAFAARHKLPILFLVANTLTPGKRQEIDLRTLYAEFGIPVFSVASNDAIAAYRVATEALHNARHSRGPCLIEALTLNEKNRNSVDALPLLRDYMERHGNWPQ